MNEKKPQTHWVVDIETLVNCFILVAQHYKTDETKVFIVHEDRNDLDFLFEWMTTCIKEQQRHITYNGLAFDSQVLQKMYNSRGALMKMTTFEAVDWIYKYAQDTIQSGHGGGFAEFPRWKLQIKQIDVYKLNHWDGAQKRSGLKWIQYSMDWPSMEEMPHEHFTPIRDEDTLEAVVNYCINDVLSTKRVLQLSTEQIRIRQVFGKEYGMDLLSSSEPSISKQLFSHHLCKKLGWEKHDMKGMGTPRSNIKIKDLILPYINFSTPEFQGLQTHMGSLTVNTTKDKIDYIVRHKDMKIVYGLGGIHGAITSKGVYEAVPGWIMMTSDVKSFYPNLSIKNGFHPEHIPQKEFCDLYKWFYDERLKYPKSNPINYVFKIVLNSTYGLSGEENSFLYDPKMMLQITINGQLSLSMLYEMLCEAIPTCKPLLLNTDGLEMLIPEESVGLYMEICKKWEDITKLELEHDRYKSLILADVNNYIAVHPSGKTKCKGRFEWEMLEKKDVSILHKNKSFLIIPKAIHAYFINGTSPEDFLASSTNVYDFCGGVKAKGAWELREMSVEDGAYYDRKLPKVVRYLITTNGSKIVKKNTSDGRIIQVEAGKWLQTTRNVIDEDKPMSYYNIEYDYYLDIIHKEIDLIRKNTTTVYEQLSLF